MNAPTTIRFRFLNVGWELHLYETVDRHGDRQTRVAAYCLSDALPRGSRRAWTLAGGRLTPWEPRYEGDWPELDAAVSNAIAAAKGKLADKSTKETYAP